MSRIYEGTYAEMIATTDAPVRSVWTVTSGTNVGNKYEYSGATAGWVQTHDAGAMHVAEVGIPSQRHNRYITGITATWPGNDTFAVTFTQTENVRRYRYMVTGGADGDYVKCCEDAANEAQAESWLTLAASASADREFIHVYTSTPDANGSFLPIWSEWQEMSKDPADVSLSRLDFLASAAGPFVIWVEAE